MEIDRDSGLLRGVRYVPSPHQDNRPEGTDVDLVVVHGISLPPGEFGGPWIERLLLGRLPPEEHPFFATIRNPRVSAHLLIRRSGALVQYVPFHRRAWHAGESSWKGREECNDFSIGIELEGTDDLPYEGAQYRALAEAIAALSTVWPAITRDRVVGHADVAPKRKTDPGPIFDWERLRNLLPHEVFPPPGLSRFRDSRTPSP